MESDHQPETQGLCFEWIDGQRGFLIRGGRRFPFSAVIDGSRIWIRWQGRTYRLNREGSSDDTLTESDGGVPEAIAPIPGLVLSIAVRPGDEVEEGSLLLTLEAMKMEHEVLASRAGRVGRLLVREGERVDAGKRLVELETRENEG